MPTKHKRKRNDDESLFDLPPTSKARSLPVITPTKDFLAPRKKQKVEGGKRPKKNVDDTPKVFARLMAWHTQGKKLPTGLDNGDKPKKAKKKQKSQDATQVPVNGNEGAQLAVDTSNAPKIRPGESLRDFSLRVDQSLPLMSIPKSNANPNQSLPADLQAKAVQKLTKHNKRLARMQAEWRNTEAKLRAKEEEEAEENVEKIEEEKLLWDGVKTGKKRKKGAKSMDDDDPWKELEKKRRDTKQKNPRDVVEAPPVLTGVKNMFKERTERTLPAISAESKKVAGRKPRLKDELAAVRRAAILEVERRKSASRPAVLA